MRFYSTRRQDIESDFSLQEAVLRGLAPDGGLFMPGRIPALPPHLLQGMPSMSLAEIGFEVARRFVEEEVGSDTLRRLVQEAIDFDAPLKPLEISPSSSIYSLELFHGPSLAFKDFGARFMARLMSLWIGEGSGLTILAATSGDTGSAVARGFLGAAGIRVVILYPEGKVSPLQECQFTTLGRNVTALKVAGTFDDCQRLVKQAFQDGELRSRLQLSSANSINIARLIPQCFYFFYAWSRLDAQRRQGALAISVPSGNFGNLTAGLMARRMGLAVTALVAATNRNDVVPEFLHGGAYRPRPSLATLSNAMDVGDPSNFERMLNLCGGDAQALRRELAGYRFDDRQTLQAIRQVEEKTGYLMDPHAAVGYLGLVEELKRHPPGTTGIFLATAHPAKFQQVVERATGRPVEMPERLARLMEREKQSTPVAADLEAVKEVLLVSR